MYKLVHILYFYMLAKHCDTANLITSVLLARDPNAINVYRYILQLLSLFKIDTFG